MNAITITEAEPISSPSNGRVGRVALLGLTSSNSRLFGRPKKLVHTILLEENTTKSSSFSTLNATR